MNFSIDELDYFANPFEQCLLVDEIVDVAEKLYLMRVRQDLHNDIRAVSIALNGRCDMAPLSPDYPFYSIQ